MTCAQGMTNTKLVSVRQCDEYRCQPSSRAILSNVAHCKLSQTLSHASAMQFQQEQVRSGQSLELDTTAASPIGFRV